jgi:hypothetical protein
MYVSKTGLPELEEGEYGKLSAAATTGRRDLGILASRWVIEVLDKR